MVEWHRIRRGRIVYGKRKVRPMNHLNMHIKEKRNLEWKKEAQPQKGKRRNRKKTNPLNWRNMWPFDRWKMKPSAALTLALVCLSCLYTFSLSDEATQVIAQKKELPVYSVERADKVIAISFDASWGGDQTIGILDTLDEYNIKTTFFLVGIWVDKYPELVKEIVARGHEIGNHSATHPHMSQISEEKIRQELRIMSDKVETLTSFRPTLFRPPYGDYNNKVVVTTRQEGYEVVQWSIDSLDWKNRGVEDIVKRCTDKVENGDIVLFHNDAQFTPEALPRVLKYYQEQGFTVIPVSQILLQGETTIDVQGKQHPVKPAQ